MLTLYLGKQELFNNETQEFSYTEGRAYHFEHSLRAISKWETKHKTPFLVDGQKTSEQTLDYIRCMCTDDSFEISLLNEEAIKKINAYILEGHTATTIKNMGANSGKIITSEVLYSYLSICDIPFDTDEWNIDRLLMVIASVSALKSPPKKMSRAEIYEQNKRLNAERRKEMNSKG